MGARAIIRDRGWGNEDIMWVYLNVIMIAIGEIRAESLECIRRTWSKVPGIQGLSAIMSCKIL
jgi:hypothetical protein